MNKIPGEGILKPVPSKTASLVAITTGLPE